MTESSNDEAAAHYEGIFSGVEPVAGAATAARDVEGAPPAGAPENPKGTSEDSTTGRLGDLSVAEEVAPATADGIPRGTTRGNGNGTGVADGMSTQPPPAKRHKPTTATATATSETAVAGSAAAAAGDVAGRMGEQELREQLAKQNRLVVEMAKELEAFRREREGSAVLPVGDPADKSTR